MIIYTTVNGVLQAMDLASYHLCQQRKIHIWEHITTELAQSVVSQIEYLDSIGDGDITLCINSPGGELQACLTIYDAMQSCRCPIRTICMGVAASAAAILLAAGTPGKRWCVEHGEIMIHQPHGAIQGEATDIAASAKRFEQKKLLVADLLASHCGKSRKSILACLEHDHWMDASAALKYGLIDHIGKPD